MIHEIIQRYENVQSALDVILLRCDALEMWGLHAMGQLKRAENSLNALHEELREAKEESAIHRSARDSWITKAQKAEAELDALKAKGHEAKWVRELKWIKVESVDQVPKGSVVLYLSLGRLVATKVIDPIHYAGKYVCILALPDEIPPMPEGAV